MTSHQKELKGKIVNAICKWLNQKEQRQSVMDCRIIYENVLNQVSNQETVNRIFDLAQPIEDELFNFFKIIYDEQFDEINIENKSKSDLDKTIVWSILENYLQAINIKSEKDKLDSGIKELFLKKSSSEDKNLLEILKNAKEKRNRVHRGHQTKELLAEVWQMQVISLYIIAFVYENPNKREKTINNKEREESYFSNFLALWYANNKNRFNELPARYVEYYFEDSMAVISKVLETLDKKKELKETLKQILQQADANGEVMENTSVNFNLSFSSFIEQYIKQATLNIYKDAFKDVKKEISLESCIELLGKLCCHINYYKEIILEKITIGYEKSFPFNSTSQLSEECADYVNNHFFRILFIVGSLMIAIERNRTGVLYYANNDIEVLPFKKAKKIVQVTKYVPCYYHLDQIFVHGNLKTLIDKINAFRGDFSLDDTSNRNIKINKNKWTIVLLDFPPRKEGRIKDVITDVKFPGLIDFGSKIHEDDQHNEKTTCSKIESQNLQNVSDEIIEDNKKKDSHQSRKESQVADGSAQQPEGGGMETTCTPNPLKVGVKSPNSTGNTKIEGESSKPYSDSTDSGSKIIPIVDIMRSLFPDKEDVESANSTDRPNDNGENVNKEKWCIVSNYTGGFAKIQNENGKFGIINQTGKIIIPCVWTEIKSVFFDEGLACVKDDSGHWGYIDKTGILIIPCIWKDAKVFHEGLAAVVNDNGKWGFIDKSGEIVIPCNWENAEDFHNGKSIVTDNNGKTYPINKTGIILNNDNIVFPKIYESIIETQEKEKHQQTDIEENKTHTHLLFGIHEIEKIKALLHYCCEGKYYHDNDYINKDITHKKLLDITYESLVELIEQELINKNLIGEVPKLRKDPKGEPVLERISIDYLTAKADAKFYAKCPWRTDDRKKVLCELGMSQNIIIDRLCNKVNSKLLQEFFLNHKMNFSFDTSVRVDFLYYSEWLRFISNILSLQNLSKCITFVKFPRSWHQDYFEFKVGNDSIFDYSHFADNDYVLVGFSQNDFGSKEEINISGKYYFRNTIRQTEILSVGPNDYQEFVFNRYSPDTPYTLKEKFLHMIGKF